MIRRPVVGKLVSGGAAAWALVLLACAPLPPAGAVVVELRPPPERVEVIPVGPGAGFVWIRGYWSWDRHAFIWAPGDWRRLPEGYRSWVPGRWVHSRHGWYWTDGRWR